MKKHADRSDRVQDVAQSILAYFRLHPQAKDTLEGVARWWVNAEPSLAEEALDLLVRNGRVSKRRNHYCRRLPQPQVFDNRVHSVRHTDDDTFEQDS